jgi:hypothetical protein
VQQSCKFKLQYHPFPSLPHPPEPKKKRGKVFFFFARLMYDVEMAIKDGNLMSSY